MYSTIIGDLRGKTCPICRQGWKLDAESFRNQFHSCVTDEWLHKTCYEGFLEMQEATMWYNALCEPENRDNFIPFNWHKIPNAYGGGWNTSWYQVELPGYVPTIKVGSRRHVYHMGLHDLRAEQIAAFKELFKDEYVTKHTGVSEVSIHAGGKKHAILYLEKFIQIIKMDSPKEGSRAAELEAQRAAELEAQKQKVPEPLKAAP